MSLDSASSTRRPAPRMLLPLVAGVVLFSAAAHAADDLLQVLVVHRHGARRPLTKDPFDPSEERISTEPGVLYPQGETQLRNLGEYIRKTYVDDADMRLKAVSGRLQPSQVVAYSSNLERTMNSSRAFLSSLLPDADQVATLAFSSDANADWQLRGYAQCSKLTSAFEEFEKTDAYTKRKERDGQFVAALAEGLNTTDVDEDFSHVFNVYDRYTIAADYDDRPDGKKVVKLSADNMRRLRSAADWFEASKFDFVTNQVDVAGGLLRNLVDRMQQRMDVASDADSGTIIQVVEYSAHYPTLLTLLGSLRGNRTNETALTAPADAIPGFGGALIIELRCVNSAPTVHLKWFAGGAVDTVQTVDVAFGRESCDKSCELSVLRDAMTNVTASRFCDECEDNSSCRAYSDMAQVGVSAQCQRSSVVGLAVGCVVAGLVLGVLVGLLLCQCVRGRRGTAGGRIREEEHAADFGDVVE